MRNRLTILLLMLAGVAVVGGIYAATEKSPKPSLDLQVRQLIESLQEQIIPPVGTPRAEVDKIYGEPKEVPRFTGPKGNPGDYPMHTYQLLDPIGKAEFRAFLHVTYRDGKVYHAGINHICVVKGRPVYVQPPPQVTAEIERENRWVLADLLEVYNKYEPTKASWNASAPGR